MRTITGFQKTGDMGLNGRMDRTNERNLFFNRFDTAAPLPQDSAAGYPTTTATLPPATPPYRPLVCPPPPQFTPTYSTPPPCSASCSPQPEDLTSPQTVSTPVFCMPDQVRRQLMRLHSAKLQVPTVFFPGWLKPVPPSCVEYLVKYST